MKRGLWIAAFALSSLPIAGCNEGGMEEAGEKVDEAVEDAGEAVEDAGDEVEDATDGNK